MTQDIRFLPYDGTVSKDVTYAEAFANASARAWFFPQDLDRFSGNGASDIIARHIEPAQRQTRAGVISPTDAQASEAFKRAFDANKDAWKRLAED